MLLDIDPINMQTILNVAQYQLNWVIAGPELLLQYANQEIAHVVIRDVAVRLTLQNIGDFKGRQAISRPHRHIVFHGWWQFTFAVWSVMQMMFKANTTFSF